jgi:hypothetical protein
MWLLLLVDGSTLRSQILGPDVHILVVGTTCIC